MRKLLSALCLLVEMISLSSCIKIRPVEATAESVDTKPTFKGISRISDVTWSSATIEWEAVEGVSYYVVYLVDGEELIRVTGLSSSASRYVVNSLTSSTAYMYWVQAVYSDSRVDENTAVASFTTEGPVEVSAVKEVDFADSASFSYQNSKLEFVSDTAKLIAVVAGTYVDDFSDGDTSEWTGALSYSSSSLTSLTESSSVLMAQVSGLLLGLPFSGASGLTTATTSVSVTPQSFNGTALVGIMGRQTGNAYYLGTTYGSQHRILYNNGSSLSSLGTASGPAISTGITYDMKLYTSGSQIKYKMWVDGQAEPDWLVSVTNTSLSSGNSGVVVAGGRSNFSMFEVVDHVVSGGGALYPTEGIALTMPNLDFSDDGVLQHYDELVVGENSFNDGYLKYELSIDGGSTWLVPVGATWQTNVTGLSGAVDLSVINAHLSTLSIASKQIKVRAYLISTDGTRSPEIFATSVRYTKI